MKIEVVKMETKSMRLVKFSDWKIKNRAYWSKGLSSTYRVKEKIKYRDLKINDDLRLEEGIILEYLEKNVTLGEKEYKPSQQHLIGYHYISVIDSNDDDILWIQGNIRRGRRYAIFSAGVNMILNWTTKQKAMKKFKKLLKENYGLKLKD